MRKIALYAASFVVVALVLNFIAYIVAGGLTLAGVAWGAYRVGRAVGHVRALRQKAPVSRAVTATR